MLKAFSMRFVFIFILIILTLLSFKSYTDKDKVLINEFLKSELENFELSKEKKNISDLIFKDHQEKEISFSYFKGKVLLVNFWATWCAPCKREMPSLNRLYQNNSFKNLEIFAINIEESNAQKAKNFFIDHNIKKLKVFFDYNLNFVKEFKLRGVPTTVLINKEGKEFARIMGSIDFNDKKFINWLKAYN